jgi:hypothetical protein
MFCVFFEPVVVDHYHYWIGRNRQLVIVLTTVIGNTMAAERKTDCDIDNCPGVSEELQEWVLFVVLLFIQPLSGSYRNTPAAVMIRSFAPVLAVLGIIRKGWTKRL